MKFPKDVILESVAEGRDHKEYGLEFVEMLGKTMPDAARW